ncbi:hypothetical protein EJB05_42744, partial [Eragrostis curvula]
MGLISFLAEVESLTKVHHRNIVSLIGYCWEEDHLALIYEYMSQGSIFDHLRGKNDLNWGTCVRVALEAAQGLDYLHKGCSPPIIHRDVKSANILLNKNLQAKVADLGLSKTYLYDAQSHISVTAAGTAGYMDPQYVPPFLDVACCHEFKGSLLPRAASSGWRPRAPTHVLAGWSLQQMQRLPMIHL